MFDRVICKRCLCWFTCTVLVCLYQLLVYLYQLLVYLYQVLVSCFQALLRSHTRPLAAGWWCTSWAAGQRPRWLSRRRTST